MEGSEAEEGGGRTDIFSCNIVYVCFCAFAFFCFCIDMYLPGRWYHFTHFSSFSSPFWGRLETWGMLAWHGFLPTLRHTACLSSVLK